jgi:hypothetical protein
MELSGCKELQDAAGSDGSKYLNFCERRHFSLVINAGTDT